MGFSSLWGRSTLSSPSPRSWLLLLQALSGLAPSASPPSSSSGMSGASPSLTRSRSRLGLPAGPLPPSLTPIPEGGTPAAAPPQRQPSCGAAGEQPASSQGDVVLEEDQEEACGQVEGGQAAAEGPLVELTQREGSVTTTQQTGPGCAAAAASTPQSKGPRPPGLQTTPTSQQQSAGLARLHSLLSPAAMQVGTSSRVAENADAVGGWRRPEQRVAAVMMPQASYWCTDHAQAVRNVCCQLRCGAARCGRVRFLTDGLSSSPVLS
jgi:hypothetical protein